MILSALNQYYHRLAGQVDGEGKPKVPPYGFSEEKISFCLVLSKEGILEDVQDVRDTSGKKPVPKLISVPQSFKRPGVTPRSFFLWDKTAYVLGVEGNKDKQTAKKISWLASDKTFTAFKNLHLTKLQQSEDIGLKALCLFLQNWQTSQFNQAPCVPEMLDSNVVFRLNGQRNYLHETEAARQLWASMIEPKGEATLAHCLVTGERAALARLHPAIKGVYGGQSSGGSIVSFNAESYASYSKDQGDNAPVSEAAAFAYTTALNFLLRRDNRQCVSIGDASTVFWAVAESEEKAQEAEDLFSMLINTPADDSAVAKGKLKPIMEKIAQGKPLSEIKPELAEGTRFYILGLAPNASRLSIRYWLDTDFGTLADNLAWHFKDMQLEPSAWREPPSVWRLLIQTAAQGKTENISPVLAGEVMRAILTGSRYPRALLTQIVQRFRADGDINALRVALTKAVLAREFRKQFIKEDIPMSLDSENSNEAYRLGRLFAVLERLQHATLGDINASITDRYYGAASTVPYSVFPRLLAGSQHHLSRLRKDKPGYAVNLSKDISEIMDGLPTEFKKHLSIEDQGRFAIGYYHQKQKYFEKKDGNAPAESATTPTT